MKRKFEKRLIILISLLAVFTCLVVPGHLLTMPANRKIEKNSPPYEQIAITNKYGNSIKGWYAEGKNKDKVILLLHPLRCNRSYMKDRADLFLKNGYSVCLIDMQAHGETVGKKVTFGYRESNDVIATVAYLKRVLKFDKVGVIGVSLGGAATLFGGSKINADAIVLESVYPEIQTAISNRVKMRLGPLDKFITPILMKQIKPILQIDPNFLNPIDYANSNETPKFLISGKADKRTTEKDTKNLYSAIKSYKELWLLEKAKHEDLYEYNPKEYEERVVEFFNKFI